MLSLCHHFKKLFHLRECHNFTSGFHKTEKPYPYQLYSLPIAKHIYLVFYRTGFVKMPPVAGECIQDMKGFDTIELKMYRNAHLPSKCPRLFYENMWVIQITPNITISFAVETLSAPEKACRVWQTLSAKFLQ